MLRSAVVTAGFTALAVQTLLLRELMVAWRGNEMSFGITLAVWLALTGLGGLAFGPWGRRLAPLPGTLARAHLALALLAPLALLSARFARVVLGLPAGELAGLVPLAGTAVVSLAPFTLTAGFTFALAVSVLSCRTPHGSRSIGHVYILEAVGSVVAGVLLSFVLLGQWSPTRIVSLVTLLNAAAALGLSYLPGRQPRRAAVVRLSALALVLASVAGMTELGSHLDASTVARAWHGLGFLGQANSVYGQIVTARVGSQRTIYESGVLVASVPNRLASEEAVHIPMLEHARPRRVLLLGGGLGGAVAEVLKHPTVESVDYVELDPELVHAARRAFGTALTAGFDDPRVATHFADARFFVKRARVTYDVIIVNVPDPTTAQLNRFYTVEFFREISEVLAPDGVLGLSLSSSENYIGEELAAVLKCVDSSLSEVFPRVAILPGDPCHFIASRAADLTRDPVELTSRIERRGLDVVFVRDYYLNDRLSPERVDYLDQRLADSFASLNTDFSPTCYYLSLALWNRQLAVAPHFFMSVPRFLTMRNAVIAAAALGLVLVLLALGIRSPRAGLNQTIFAAILIVGLTEMSLETAALVVFQSLYGYVYQRLALIVASFMAGLALGGLLGTMAGRAGAQARSFVALQAGMCAVPLTLAVAVLRIGQLSAEALERWAAYFPIVVVASAVLAGIQFPLAGRLARASRQEAGAIGGRLYGADLLGSAIGAPVAAIFLLPVLGVVSAMLALAALNAAVLAGLIAATARVQRSMA